MYYQAFWKLYLSLYSGDCYSTDRNSNYFYFSEIERIGKDAVVADFNLLSRKNQRTDDADVRIGSDHAHIRTGYSRIQVRSDST
jgi:hypothetical protein